MPVMRFRFLLSQSGTVDNDFYMFVRFCFVSFCFLFVCLPVSFLLLFFNTMRLEYFPSAIEVLHIMALVKEYLTSISRSI